MRLVEIKKETAKKKYRDKKKNLWSYIPSEDKREKIDHKNIIGDIGCKAKEKAAVLEDQTGKSQIAVGTFHTRLGYSKKVKGYIPCQGEDGDNYYVRIVGTSILKVLVPAAIVLLLAFSAIVWLFSDSGKPRLDEAAIAYQMPGGVTNEDPSQIMMPGFGTIKLLQNSQTVNAALANPEGNPCYFKYVIVLEESQEIIYESGWLEPGTAVTEWEINRELDLGKHPIRIEVQTGSLQDYEQKMNEGTINATLEVVE